MKLFFKWFFTSLLTFSSFSFLYTLNKMNVLTKNSFFIVSVVIVILWTLYMLFTLKKRKRKRKIFKILIYLFYFVIFIFFTVLIRTLNSTKDYAEKITSIKYQTITYKVLTLKELNYANINQLNESKIGFLTNDNYLSNCEDRFSKIINYESIKYEDIGNLIGDLYKHNVNAVVINENYISLFEDNNLEFIREYFEIYSFKIKVKYTKKDISINKDLNDPFIVYISGSDSRGVVSDIARSDVNIVGVVNPKDNKILLISIPRDYYVQLHGTTGTKDKLTHAGVYGIEKSITTIEDLLDIDINYHVKVSFKTVINLVDIIDGIDVYSDTEFNSYGFNHVPCNYIVGNNHLNGECALAFARERYIYASGDRHRGQNQQAVITSVVKKMSDPKYLIRYNDILKATDGTLQTDFTYEQLSGFVKEELSTLSKWNVESISLDGYGAYLPTYSMGSVNLYVMIPDENTVNNAKNKIKQYMK